MSSKSLETQHRILESTRQLLVSRQGKGVRMADIAKDSGVSRQAVYLHFGSRPELLVAAVRYADSMLNLDGRLSKVREATCGPVKLEAFIDFWGNYVPEIYGIAKALMLSRETDEAAAAAWDDRMMTLRNGCQDVMKSLKAENQLRDDWSAKDATDMLWTTLSIVSWEQLTIERGWSIKRYVKKMQIVAKSTFLTSPPKASSKTDSETH